MGQFHVGWLLTLMGFVFFCLWIIRKRRQPGRKPVICVCECNGCYGVVLRDDYNKASYAHWEPYHNGEKQYDWGHISAPRGRLLEVEPVFVFRDFNLLYTITVDCYTESAEFYVPMIPKGEPGDIKAAWTYLFGKEYAGEYAKF